MIRVLGKGQTAQAIKDNFDNVVLYDENDFCKYDTNSNDITVVSPGIPPHNFMVKSANNIISDYDLVYKKMPYSVWISGTNGKTTTTQMITHLLENYGAVYGGNIGVPVTSLDTNANIWVLETSSFTLHYTKSAKPNLYILLPISEDHISWHETFEEYEKSKLKAMDFMEEGEVAIIPSKYKDYPTNAYKICYETSKDLVEFFEIDIDKISFKEPFLQDALLAMAVSKILFDKLDYEKINNFKVDSHKLEEFKDSNNRVWYDDSKATNIDATIKALENFKNKKLYLIVGGDDKGANLEPLFIFLKDFDIELFAIGSNTNKIIEFSKRYNINGYKCNILKNAVEKISLKHNQNSIAILSPAAASLDQFSSYKHRGEEFKKAVYCLSLN